MARTIDPGRIGPNAVIQLRDVLAEAIGAARGRALFEAAGQAGWWDEPPSAMVPEAAVRDVHAAVVRALPARQAASLLEEAGYRTGAYILAYRIPAFARWLLPRLPARLAARLLVRAIARHAWTFCGTGAFRYRLDGRLDLAVMANPLAVAPGDPWHRAVFETLFRHLVSPSCRVVGKNPAGPAPAGTAFSVLGPGFGL
ncbi:bacteriochlorophyll 4-vinyl reductase [Rhabdaerophilum sp. SD176]|uniref:bacteriochlorophyll 4-vinyl reductase n=1 Tax=Rhabdaerophilum sp. SD176 TaxID=2983548 RepID=UPI0024DFBAE1|nr:bacteriochlorophyll 4-vinyl reductase [Rhabdaerophilum sp. SD176]